MTANPETQIVTDILLGINMFPNVIARRVNSTGIPDGGAWRKQGSMSAVGMSDIIIRAKRPRETEGVVIFLEVKTETGHLNDNQRQFAADCERMGCIYEVARSRHDALEVLRKHKVIGGELL